MTESNGYRISEDKAQQITGALIRHKIAMIRAEEANDWEEDAQEYLMMVCEGMPDDIYDVVDALFEAMVRDAYDEKKKDGGIFDDGE